jgi:hypothetical protein
MAPDLKKPTFDNSSIAEILAIEGDAARPRLCKKAFRRASRRAYLWPEEATLLIQGRPLADGVAWRWSLILRKSLAVGSKILPRFRRLLKSGDDS